MIELDDIQKQYFIFENQRLAYITVGDPTAPAIIMLHGWISHLGIWRHTIELLQKHYYCVAIDLLGHGHSDKPIDGDYSIPAHARRIQALIGSLGLKTFALFGHSMGAQISFYIALADLNAVTHILDVSGVVNGHLTAYVRYFLTPFFWLGSKFPSLYKFSSWMARHRWYTNIYDKALFYRPLDVIFHEDIDRLMTHVDGIGVPAYQYLIAIKNCDLTQALHKINIPTLVIFGRQDNTVRLENAYLASERIPGSHLLLFDQCGHVPMIEQTNDYLSAIKQFLLESSQ